MKTANFKIVATGLIFLWAFSIAGLAMAEENFVEIREVTMIQAPDNSSYHILAQPDLGLPDSTVVIDQATLNLVVSPQTEDSSLISIQLYPIRIAWSSDVVDWNIPWSTPGGDFDESNYTEFTISAPVVQEVNIDVTDLCQRWADGRLPYYGFLLKISESSLAGLTFLHGRDSNGPFGTLTVTFTRMQSE
jgi:hypothetical protein